MDQSAQDLELLIGKKVRIERSGEAHEGYLVESADGQSTPVKKWALVDHLPPDETEQYFAADEGWTVTHLPDDVPPGVSKPVGQN